MDAAGFGSKRPGVVLAADRFLKCLSLDRVNEMPRPSYVWFMVSLASGEGFLLGLLLLLYVFLITGKKKGCFNLLSYVGKPNLVHWSWIEEVGVQDGSWFVFDRKNPLFKTCYWLLFFWWQMQVTQVF